MFSNSHALPYMPFLTCTSSLSPYRTHLCTHTLSCSPPHTHYLTLTFSPPHAPLISMPTHARLVLSYLNPLTSHTSHNILSTACRVVATWSPAKVIICCICRKHKQCKRRSYPSLYPPLRTSSPVGALNRPLPKSLNGFRPRTPPQVCCPSPPPSPPSNRMLDWGLLPIPNGGTLEFLPTAYPVVLG